MIRHLLHPIRRYRHRRAVRWLQSRPPGYGEQYHYRSYFDAEPEPEPEQRRELLAPMPDPGAEHTSIITAFQALTACRACGYQARICSAEACPQRHA